jgi:hypothetical protein
MEHSRTCGVAATVISIYLQLWDVEQQVFEKYADMRGCKTTPFLVVSVELNSYMSTASWA